METRKFKQVPSINRIGKGNPNIPRPVIVSRGRKEMTHERIVTSPMHSNSRTISVGEPINWNEVYS